MSKITFHARALPDLLEKNLKATLGLLLLILAGGMLFFQGEKLNNLIDNIFVEFGADGVYAIAGGIAFALILATLGYLMRKKN